MTYGDFIKQTQFLKDKIILPNGTRISKSRWITPKGFDFDLMNKFLLKTYKELYEKKTLRNR